MFLPPLAVEQPVPLRKFWGLVRGKLIEQLSYLTKNREVTNTLLIAAVVLSVGAGMGSLAPGFAEQVLGIDARDLSFVAVLPLGLGLFLGTMILSQRGRLVPVWASIFGIGVVSLLLSTSPFLRTFLGNHLASPRGFEQVPFFSLTVAFLCFILGFLASGVSIPVVASLQRITTSLHMGRTFAAMGTVSSILTPAVSLIFGPVADLTSPLVPMVGMGLVACGAALWVRSRVRLK